VSVTALLVAVVTGAVVVVRAAGARREERHAPSIAAWDRFWREMVAGRETCPEGPIPDDAIVALLAVRESLDPPESLRAAEAIFSTGTDQTLMKRLDALAPAGNGTSGFRPIRGSRQLGAALDTLDDLATARLPAAIPTLTALVHHREEAIRSGALRAASRSIAAMPADTSRTAAALDLLDHIQHTPFTRGSLDEAELLLGDAAEPVIHAVLADPQAEPTLVASCLDSTARLRLESEDPLITPFLRAGRPLEVRAAAFRALATLDSLTPEATKELSQAISDPHDIVRIQAARAARLLPANQVVPSLVGLLGDQSWSVRRAAAETLAAVPGVGVQALVDAARHNPDRYARDMAHQVARDHNVRMLDEYREVPESA
jgi:hypothetical protein